MTSTSLLALSTFLHCPGAGGWFPSSDPLEFSTLITALYLHTVQMGPFVGLLRHSGGKEGGWGPLRGGCQEDLLCHLKKGGNSKHRAEAGHCSGRQQEPFL